MKKLIGAFLLLTLSACNFQPPRLRPAWPMPCTWRWNEVSTARSANLRWWEAFGDPILTGLIETSLRNNQNLMVATATVAQFFYQYEVAWSQLFPQINAQSVSSRTQLPLPAFPRRLNQFSDIVQLAPYEVDIWGRLRSLSDSAFFEFLSEIDARKVVMITLVSQVADAYIQLRMLDWQKQITEETLKVRERSLEINNIRFKEGLVSQLEVEQAKSLVEEARVTLVQIEAQIPIQEDLLSFLVGANPSYILRGTDLKDWHLPLDVPVGLPSDLLYNRPDIVQAEHTLLALNAQVGAARAAFFPPILLTGYYGGQSSELKHVLSGANRIWNITSTLTQVIFDAGRLFANLKITEAEKCEAVHNYVSTVQAALQQTSDALISHIKAKELYEEQKKLVETFEAYYKFATLQYENGFVDYLNVVQAQTNLFDAQLNLATDQALRYSTLVSIYVNLGGGWLVEADYDLSCRKS